MTAAVTEARRQGARTVACASTGNTAASMAAYAARANLRARVYLPRGATSMAKLAQALDFGAEIQYVEGNFDDALRTLMAEPDPSIYFLNSINPFRCSTKWIGMRPISLWCRAAIWVTARPSAKPSRNSRISDCCRACPAW
jgi:threonine synthase